jgi:hypothetical protein
MPLAAFLGLGLAFFGAPLFLFYSESSEEYGVRRNRIDTSERQNNLAYARDLETAGRFGEAVEIYERYGMLGEAGRMRALNKTRNIRIVGTAESQPTIKEKEIIREKEIITKVRCQYCNGLYDETLDKCPHCNARR